VSGFTNIQLSFGGAAPIPPLLPVTVLVTVALRPFTANLYGGATADTPGGIAFGVFNPNPFVVAGVHVTRLDSAGGFNQFEIWCPSDLVAVGYHSVDIHHALGVFHANIPAFNPAFGYPLNTVTDLWKAADVGLTYAVTFNP
jgi:hypothetical protein